MKKILVNSYVFEDNKQDVVYCKEKSRTQQHLKEEVDINNIVARAVKTGILGDPVAMASRKAIFGDFSEVGSFHESLNKVKAAEEAFMELPADVRKRFDHDPGKVIEYLNSIPVDNLDLIKEAVGFGLVEKSYYDEKVAAVTAAKVAAEEAAKVAALKATPPAAGAK